MEYLAEQFATIPGVVAVSLGGSRATGLATEHSDWDFGLYYRGALDVDAIRALGFDGQVFAPGEWGLVVNGGAWFTIDGERVDLIYRDLDQVEEWTAQAERGEFRIFREVGYVAGIPTYVAPAELALQRVLVGELPRPAFPDALRAAAPSVWRNLANGALKIAHAHALRGDTVACAGNLAVAMLSEAHARFCERGAWYLPEKDMLSRTGLADDLAGIDDDPIAVVARLRAPFSGAYEGKWRTL
jgi:hypothetical protein